MALPVTLRALGARTGARRVLLAYAVYCLVEMAMWIAIILYAFAQGGSTTAGIVAVSQLVPAALLELKDPNAVIRQQVATALPLLACNIVLMYVIVFR